MDDNTLEELGGQLHKWLQEKYNIHTSIIIDSHGVKIVTDEKFIPFPVND